MVYNIAAFALTAGEFRERAVKAFPGAKITFAAEPAPAGHRQFVAGGRGRFARPR